MPDIGISSSIDSKKKKSLGGSLEDNDEISFVEQEILTISGHLVPKGVTVKTYDAMREDEGGGALWLGSGARCVREGA